MKSSRLVKKPAEQNALKLGIAADHGGFELKKFLLKKFQDAGYEVIDFGDTVLNPDDDYPDYAFPLAGAIATGNISRGIAVCGSGVGACIAANKTAGVRAIYNLWLDKWMPDEFAVIGISRIKMTEKQFEKNLHEGVDKFSRRGKSKRIEWDNFAKCLTYQIGEFDAAGTYPALKKQIAGYEKKWKAESYTSGTPEAYETLLLDIMEDDDTLFMRANQVEAAWKALMPIINSWAANPPINFPNYKAGADGPEGIQKYLLQNMDIVGFNATGVVKTQNHFNCCQNFFMQIQ